MIQIREMQVRDTNAVAEIERQKTKASQELFWKYVHQMTVPSGCMNAMGLYSVVCAKDFMNFQKRMPM